MADEAVQRALRQRPYVLAVPEQREALFRTTFAGNPTIPPGEIRAAIQRVASEQPMVIVHVPPASASRDDQIDKVLDDIKRGLLESLETGSYRRFSAPGEYWVAVNVCYDATIDQAVIEEVRDQYKREYSAVRPARPFFRHFFRYNICADIRRVPKKTFLVSFYFQFIQDPDTLPEGSRFHPNPQ